MQAVYLIGRAAISALGNTLDEQFTKVVSGSSGLSLQEDQGITADKFWASRVSEAQWADIRESFSGSGLYSRFEMLCLAVARQAITESGIDATSSNTIFILSTTKGNIEALGQVPDAQIYLHYSAAKLQAYFKAFHQPLVVSNACISGSVAQMMAKRMLAAGLYQHAVVIGCDILSGFVFQGFQAFHAIASSACRPFDKNRNGINLGEASACMVLSVSGKKKTGLQISGAAASNDANHLSGPSRTGQELANAISLALAESGKQIAEVGMISAHGTATVYNDEMEAKALALAGLENVGLHSLKSFIGHTLGAAGIIESIMAGMAMEQQLLLPSLNFENSGVSVPVKVVTAIQPATFTTFVKTASGFGGCNAALVWELLS